MDDHRSLLALELVHGLDPQPRLNLALAEERRFGSGIVYLCYRPA